MAVVIIILVVLAIVVAGVVVWNISQRSIAPGPRNRQIPPGPGPSPNYPGFTPHQPPNANYQGSFTEQYRTNPGAPPPPSPPIGKTNSFGTVRTNTSAICRLTGKRTADCTCERCTKLRKKV